MTLCRAKRSRDRRDLEILLFSSLVTNVVIFLELLQNLLVLGFVSQTPPSAAAIGGVPLSALAPGLSSAIYLVGAA